MLGHTAGSLSIQYKSSGPTSSFGGDTVLFSGDHIAYSGKRQALEGFKRYNHGNLQVQHQSIQLLASDEFDFTWVLPGHGRMVRFPDRQAKNAALEKAAEEFAAEDEMDGMLSVGYF